MIFSYIFEQELNGRIFAYWPGDQASQKKLFVKELVTVCFYSKEYLKYPVLRTLGCRNDTTGKHEVLRVANASVACIGGDR